MNTKNKNCFYLEQEANICLAMLNAYDNDKLLERTLNRNQAIGTWTNKQPEIKKPKPRKIVDMSKKQDLFTNTVAIEKLKKKIKAIKIKLPIKAERKNAYRQLVTNVGIIRYKVAYMPCKDIRLHFGTANSIPDAEKSSKLMFQLFNEEMNSRK